MIISKQNQRTISIVLNLFVAIFEIYVLVVNLSESGGWIFLFFTDISNFFALLTSLAYVVYFVFFFKRENQKVPTLLSLSKYFSCCMMFLTSCVVIFVLVPLGGGLCAEFILFFGTMLFTHTLCPLITTISFILFERNIKLKLKHFWSSIVPPLMYGLAVIILDLCGVVVAPYGFLRLLEHSVALNIVSISALIVGIYCLNLLLYFFRRVKIKKIKRTTIG